MNRARPMAARLIKPRVDYEPRSAPDRAVNKQGIFHTNFASLTHYLSSNRRNTNWFIFV